MKKPASYLRPAPIKHRPQPAESSLSPGLQSPSDKLPAVANAAQKDEIRCYRVPLHILEEEKELLECYKTDEIAKVLSALYDEFYLMLTLLKGYSAGLEDEGYIYFLFTKQLEKPLEMLSKVCSVLTDFELLSVRAE